jgi:predicted GNAT family acetyltransferase
MSDILSYYSRSPSSGFWILDYGNQFLGLIALDASYDSPSTQSDSSQKSTGSANEAATQRGSAKTAIIRHFYIDEVYRGSGIQADLLGHAVQSAFDSDDQVLRIRAPDSPLHPYIGSCLQEGGFAIEHPIEEVGLFRWNIVMRTLERGVWENRVSASQ